MSSNDGAELCQRVVDAFLVECQLKSIVCFLVARGVSCKKKKLCMCFVDTRKTFD